MVRSSSALLFLVLSTACTSGRSFPNYDYGGQTHSEFLTSAIERSSPGNARLLAELFGGLEIGIDLGGGAQAVISVGGAATKCQHQSPCYDAKCQLCYDPLLRVHGICGGASYYTCRGSLPKACLPYQCTATRSQSRSKSRTNAKSSSSSSGSSSNNSQKTVFVKKFSRYQDLFCIGVEEPRDGGAIRAKREQEQEYFEDYNSAMNTSGEEGTTPTIRQHPRDDRALDGPDPGWLMAVPNAITPCQGYDVCMDLRCGSCYDSYLGAHTSCGRMSYYDCKSYLPDECRPLRCTENDVNVKELFPMTTEGKPRDPKSAYSDPSANADKEGNPLMVRNFGPLIDQAKNCV